MKYEDAEVDRLVVFLKQITAAAADREEYSKHCSPRIGGGCLMKHSYFSNIRATCRPILCLTAIYVTR